MQISTSVGVAQDICRLLRFRHRKEYTAALGPGHPLVGAFLATACRSGEMAARQGARTGLGCRLLGPLGLSTFDKSSGHPLVGAFPLCARSATAYANSLIGNQAQPRLDRPWHTAPRRGSGFRPTILIARAAERPRHGNQGGWGGGVFPRGYGHEHHERTWFLPCDRSSRRRRTEICLPDVRVGICIAPRLAIGSRSRA
jgi:hypothetical protein